MNRLLSFGMIALTATAFAEGPVYRIHGESWAQAGRIVSASDSVLFDNTYNNVSGNNLQSLGAQVRVDADLGDHWRGSFGLGVYQVSHSLGTVAGSTNYSDFFNVSMFRSYLAGANLTWFAGDASRPWLSVTAGNFAYDYNPDAKDFGLYLTRGPVYPGVLMSGFGDFATDTNKATQLGFRVHNEIGSFSQDLLFLNEQALPPTFDWSVAYVAKFKAFDALELGAGVNFYRLIPYSAVLETPGHMGLNAPTNSYEVTAPGDTVFYTHQGTKLMAMVSFDPKRWLSWRGLGGEDLKLYGEAAILGVKNYGSYYDDLWQRVPVMGGFNLPAFGILDLLSVEVEWYGSPYKNDLALVGYPSAVVAPWQDPGFGVPSPGPVSPGAYADSSADNFKWSVSLQKTVSRHVRFVAQVANDHYRPGPLSKDFNHSSGGTQAVMTRPGDWYFMGKLGFFF